MSLAAWSQQLQPMKDVDAFKRKVQEASGNISSIESAFVQEKHLAALAEPDLSSGTFYYSSGAKVRWEYAEPRQQSIILNDGKFTMLENGTEVRTGARAARAYQRINALMAEVIHNNTFGDDAFEYDFLHDGVHAVVRMTPTDRNMAEHVSHMELFFADDYRVREMRMTAANGDFTVYRFSNQVYNQPVSAEVFKPEPLR